MACILWLLRVRVDQGVVDHCRSHFTDAATLSPSAPQSAPNIKEATRTLVGGSMFESDRDQGLFLIAKNDRVFTNHAVQAEWVISYRSSPFSLTSTRPWPLYIQAKIFTGARPDVLVARVLRSTAAIALALTRLFLPSLTTRASLHSKT